MSKVTDYHRLLIDSSSALSKMCNHHAFIEQYQIYFENKYALKKACKYCNLSLTVINWQEHRLDLDMHYNLYMYVLYNNQLPEIMQQEGYHLTQTDSEVVSNMKAVLAQCKYQVKHKNHHYYLIDMNTHKDLKTFQDYEDSILMKNDLEQMSDLFTKTATETLL